jgi:hypothetical protein
VRRAMITLLDSCKPDTLSSLGMELCKRSKR